MEYEFLEALESYTGLQLSPDIDLSAAIEGANAEAVGTHLGVLSEARPHRRAYSKAIKSGDYDTAIDEATTLEKIYRDGAKELEDIVSSKGSNFLAAAAIEILGELVQANLLTLIAKTGIRVSFAVHRNDVTRAVDSANFVLDATKNMREISQYVPLGATIADQIRRVQMVKAGKLPENSRNMIIHNLRESLNKTADKWHDKIAELRKGDDDETAQNQSGATECWLFD